jgi:hypothetical protein
LFFSYFSSGPKEPRPELGLVYALNNHGSYVYLSGTESTALSLLMMAFATAVLLSGIAKTDLGNHPSGMKAAFLGSLAFSFAIILLAGRPIVDFVVGRGIVLPPW